MLSLKRRRAWSIVRSPSRVALVTAAAVGFVVTLTPASGAAGDIATGFARAVRHLSAPMRNGQPFSGEQPVTCQNWLREPMRDQLEFDCGGYTNGTSGGPFLRHVDPSTGQGRVIGVIGGYQQGGNTPQVSYSAVLGGNAAALYKTAVAGG